MGQCLEYMTHMALSQFPNGISKDAINGAEYNSLEEMEADLAKKIAEYDRNARNTSAAEYDRLSAFKQYEIACGYYRSVRDMLIAREADILNINFVRLKNKEPVADPQHQQQQQQVTGVNDIRTFIDNIQVSQPTSEQSSELRTRYLVFMQSTNEQNADLAQQQQQQNHHVTAPIASWQQHQITQRTTPRVSLPPSASRMVSSS